MIKPDSLSKPLGSQRFKILLPLVMYNLNNFQIAFHLVIFTEISAEYHLYYKKNSKSKHCL